MEITTAQRKELLDYLKNRPYAEVFTLIDMLVSLKPDDLKPNKTNGKKDDDVTPKN